MLLTSQSSAQARNSAKEAIRGKDLRSAYSIFTILSGQSSSKFWVPSGDQKKASKPPFHCPGPSETLGKIR